MSAVVASGANRQWGYSGKQQIILNPANHRDAIGEVLLADLSAVDQTFSIAHSAAPKWANNSASERAALLERTGT